MNATLLSLSALLSYPDADLAAALPEIRAHLQSEAAAGRLRAASLSRLNSLIDHLAGQDLLGLQEAYVTRFDTGRYSSLHLFEHIHGESRDRGQAMVDLRQRYEDGGLELAVSELPDYLPLLLEFLATRDLAEQQELIGDFSSIINLIARRLQGDQSPWAAVFAAIWETVGLPDPVVETKAEPEDAQAPLSAVEQAGATDDDWEEKPAWGPDSRLMRRIVGGGLHGGDGPRHAPEGLPQHHPLHAK